MLACISIRTQLQFAKCAVNIKVAPKVNETEKEEGLLAEYLRQIEDLREQLKVS